MEGDALMRWQRRLRFTDKVAAAALRLSPRTFQRQKSGGSRVTGQTELLSLAVEAWGPDWPEIARLALKNARTPLAYR